MGPGAAKPNGGSHYTPPPPLPGALYRKIGRCSFRLGFEPWGVPRCEGGELTPDHHRTSPLPCQQDKTHIRLLSEKQFLLRDTRNFHFRKTYLVREQFCDVRLFVGIFCSFSFRFLVNFTLSLLGNLCSGGEREREREWGIYSLPPPCLLSEVR